MKTEIHTISPVYDQYSQLLILGSFPSVKSRQAQFFYGHPQNRFWKVLAAVTQASAPQTIEEKKHFLLSHHIAVWDVIQRCDIEGSSDSSIKNAVPNNLDMILTEAPIRHIFTNGNKSYELYQKYCYPQTQRPAVKLPSTSPANAAYSLDRLIMEWREKICCAEMDTMI